MRISAYYNAPMARWRGERQKIIDPTAPLQCFFTVATKHQFASFVHAADKKNVSNTMYENIPRQRETTAATTAHFPLKIFAM
jgi:hypothetical protein